MRRVISLLFLALALGLKGQVLLAQAAPPAGLTADRVIYTSGYRTLRASGNVEIIFGTTILQASAVTYDQHNDVIRAEGPLELSDGKNVTIVASFAELSGDLKRGVLKSARMVLNEQLQLAAVEINRTDGRYNQLFKAAASSCKVSQAHPTPLWQIRARRIIHDEEKKLLFFEHAQVRFWKIPVAYLPRMRVPDPSVKRASGFLVPGVSNRDTLGTGINVPYFLTLGDHADVTLTPYIYSSGTATLGYAFRKRFRNGELNAQGAYTRDNVTAYTDRAYLFADGNLEFRNGLQAEMQLQFTSDESYLQSHGISDQLRLESFLNLNRTTRRSQFGANVQEFRSFSTAITPDEIPYLLSDINYRRRWRSAVLGGQIGFSAQSATYTRQSVTNISGRDTWRLATVADWRREWITRGGAVFGATAELHGDMYNIQQDSTFTSPLFRTTPIAAVEFRMPFARSRGNATEVIEPRAQLVWSQSGGTAVPDEDSQLVEFEATNLFALNHFTGIDQYETGLRANIGVSYSRKSSTGWDIEVMAGKVIRASDPGQFAVASGLSGTASSYVLAAQMALPSKIRLMQRTVFGNSLGITKNETRVGFKTKRFNIGSSYLWLSKDAAGNTASDRSEWVVDTGINLGNNWRSEANWRYDLATRTASDAGFGVTYSNDCVKVDLSLSRQFTASSNVAPSTSIGLQVSLEGFGSRLISEAPGRNCTDF